jgi:hypothetical protein
MKHMKKIQVISNDKRLDLIDNKENICEEPPHDSHNTSKPTKTNAMDIESEEITSSDGQ